MKLIIKKTDQIEDNIFDSYITGFNNAFNSSNDKTFFKKKYLESVFGFSFHCFVIENNIVKGCCTVIPFDYNIKNNIKLVGLAVDVFVSEDFRSQNPFLLLKMYYTLKKYLRDYNIKAIVAVPNDNAYMYWKKVVKWKDLKQLSYYIYLNKIPKLGRLNTRFSSKILFHSQKLFNSFFFKNDLTITKKKYEIEILKNNYFKNSRYCGDQIIFSNDSFYFTYSIHNEKGINVCYLIDHKQNGIGIESNLSLEFAVNHIRKLDVIFIIFVGEISYNQKYLRKVPSFLEPRKLNLMIDIIDKKYSKVLLDSNNWDFGLANYDVR